MMTLTGRCVARFFISRKMPQYTYNGVTVTATRRRPSSRDDKKYMRTVTVDGKEHLVHYGDPNMEMQRDIPERRQAFLERHSCSTKKDPLAPGYWACLDWQRTSEKSADDDMGEIKAGRRNNRSDRQRIKSIRQAATSIMVAADEMEPDGEEAMQDQVKALSLDEQVEKVKEAIWELTYSEGHAMMNMPPVETSCEAVFADYCIIERDDNYYQANYTITDNKVAIAPMDTWQKVEEAWLPAKAKKTAPVDMDETEDTQPVIFGTVKAVKSDDGEWVLDVLGVPFGGHNNGRDSDGEYFSAQTKTYTDRFATVPAIYYHGYDEHNQPSSEPEYIGAASYDHTDAKGHWYRVILDKASTYAQRVWDAAKQGIARASSGSITHLVRKQKDGHITHWPVAELSIFDAIGNRQPANQYAVAMPVMKAVWNRAGLDLPEDINPDSEQTPEDAAIGDDRTSAQGRASAEAKTDDQQSSENMESKTMELEQTQVSEIVAQTIAAEFAKRDAAAKAAKEQLDREKEIAAEAAKAARAEVEEAAKAEREKLEAELKAAKEEAAEARRLPTGGAPHVTQFANAAKFDGLSIEDLAFTAGILEAAKGQRVGGRVGEGASEDLRRALAVRLLDSDEGKAEEYRSAKAEVPQAMKAMKANELNQSTLSNYGDQWVGVTYSTMLWDKIRLQAQIVSNIPSVQVPQGSESIVIPVMGTSPTFYKVAQASAQDSNPGRVTPTVTTSRGGTANKTLTVSKLGAAVNYTGELEEDSLIPWVSELRADLIREGAEVLEHVVIDGDTATGGTTNINDIQGTPAGTEPFLMFDGFRKLALVTNTANARSAGTLTIEDYLETVKLMGLGGQNAMDKARVAFIVDMFTGWKSLELAELKTKDVHSMPTIESGVLTGLYGYKIHQTNNMHRANQDATYGLRANTAGKIDLDTASNNTTGSILAVRWDQWRLGYKRNWTFEVQRDAISDSTAIVGMMRVGMVYRDTEASAISYNVTL